MRRNKLALAALAAAGFTAGASANITATFSDASGLGAEAVFTLINPTTLQISLKNTSTGVPGGATAADSLLTAVAWDFGPFGAAGITITGGTAATGPTSMSLNFDILNVGSGADVSGEWGYDNGNNTGLLQNAVSTIAAQSTPFGGANLDGPASLNGPQGGIAANPLAMALGGLGAVQDEVIFTLTLSGAITKADLLNDLVNNGVRVEFGSDYAFLEGTVPSPGALALLGFAGLVGIRPRRKR